MDGQRFDDLTRLIGTGSSRRRVLRLLLGSALSIGGLGGVGRSALAQGCTSGGAPCVTDDECCTGACADGTCVCLGEGDPCVFATDCCGGGVDDLLCVDGVCARPTCTPEFEDCGRYGPCCAGACVGEGALVCVFITCLDDGACPTNGSCVGGICVRGTCDVDFYCPAGVICVDGSCVEPCADAGDTCGDPAPACCGGLSCAEGVCVEPVTCASEGDGCVDDTNCCGSLPCTDGVCAQPDDGTGGPDDGGDLDGSPDEPPVGNPTLPATGVGRADPGPEPMVAITLAGAAVALLAAERLRHSPKAPPAADAR